MPSTDGSLPSTHTGTYDRRPVMPSIHEVMAAHLDHAEQHYRRPDGTQTHEVDEYKLVYRLAPRAVRRHARPRIRPAALKAVAADVHRHGLVPVAREPADRPGAADLQVGRVGGD